MLIILSQSQLFPFYIIFVLHKKNYVRNTCCENYIVLVLKNFKFLYNQNNRNNFYTNKK